MIKKKRFLIRPAFFCREYDVAGKWYNIDTMLTLWGGLCLLHILIVKDWINEEVGALILESIVKALDRNSQNFI